MMGCKVKICLVVPNPLTPLNIAMPTCDPYNI